MESSPATALLRAKSSPGTGDRRTVGHRRCWAALLGPPLLPTGAQGPETWRCAPSSCAMQGHVRVQGGGRVAQVTVQQDNRAVLGWLPMQLLVH